ncbi:MAG: metallophosphoesterase [Candidatus Caenarcaniphilales bacterium]|nr:metallophosphoesterase [Candidatus Caenarcaniphilales bacterium]
MNRRDFLKLLLLSSASLALKASPLQFAPPIISARNKWVPKISSESFGFIAMGDMGTGWKTQYELIKLANNFSPENTPAVILLGDIIYPSAKPELIDPNFIKPFAPMLEKGFKFYPVWGNHDWIADKAVHLKSYFLAPDYYNFRIGPSEIWNLNSNEFDQKQANWLNSSLASSQAIWKIVNLHHSPYSSGLVHHNNVHLIKNLCPILDAHGVDLCLSGHNHLYERTDKINSTVYVVSGGGSASLHKFADKVDFPRLSINSSHHFLHVTGNYLNLSLKSIDIKGNLIDQTALTK